MASSSSDEEVDIDLWASIDLSASLDGLPPRGGTVEEIKRKAAALGVEVASGGHGEQQLLLSFQNGALVISVLGEKFAVVEAAEVLQPHVEELLEFLHQEGSSSAVQIAHSFVLTYFEEEEEEESSSEDSAGDVQARLRDELNVVPTLKECAVTSLARNLPMYSGFEQLPMDIRALVFVKLIEMEAMSSKRLRLLLNEDNVRVDLSRIPHAHDRHIEALLACPRLVKLNLSSLSRIKSFAALRELHKLQELDVSGTSFASKDLEAVIDGCPSITALDVSGTLLGDDGSLGAALKRFARLVSIKLNDMPHLSGATLFSALCACPRKMRTLEAQNILHSEHGYPEVNGTCNLVKLDLSRNSWITDRILKRYLRCSFPQAQHVWLQKCPGVTHEGRAHFWSLCVGGLRSVSVSDTQAPALYNLERVGGANPLVSKLWLLRVPVAGVGDVAAAAGAFKLLQRLVLRNLGPNLALMPLLALLKKRTPKLRELCCSKARMGKVKSPSILHGVLKVELDLIDGLNDQTFKPLISCFPSLRSFSCGGAELGRESLRSLVMSCSALRELQLNHSSGIPFPLSVLFDEPAEAQLRSLVFIDFFPGELFDTVSLDGLLDERRMPMSSITSLTLKPKKRNYTLPRVSEGLGPILQAFFFSMPSLRHLDISDVFVAGAILEFPSLAPLQKLTLCSFHDSDVQLVNLPLQCKIKRHKCPDAYVQQDDESSEEMFMGFPLF